MKRFVCHIINLLMRIGKPLAVTGIILILVMLLGTCGSDDIDEADKIEYTDVEYSEDKSSVTIYLDGIGVPKQKAQRALSKDFAQAAFDLIEVVFVSGGTTARASWILGKPANILGVPGKTGAAVDYVNIYPDTGAAACMFVGRDEGKSLLGVGRLTGTRGTKTAPINTTVDANTKSVTFSITAIKTGLIIQNETLDTNDAAGIMFDSFTYNGATSGTTPGYVGGYNTRDARNTFRVSLGNTNYAVYISPINGNSFRTYTFSIDSNYLPAIRQFGNSDSTEIQKRTPRYRDTGGFNEPKNAIDFRTTIDKRTTKVAGVEGVYNPIADTPFDPSIELVITGGGEPGIFSFNIQIPVYMVNKTPEFIKWYIRSGVASEFYSLDDGRSTGGCVLISVNTFNNNQNESVSKFNSTVEWTWFKQ